MNKHTLYSYAIAVILSGVMSPLLAITTREIKDADNKINQFIALDIDTVTPEEFKNKKDTALRAVAKYGSALKAKYSRVIQAKDKQYVDHTYQPPKKVFVESAEESMEDGEAVEVQAQPKKKSWFKKYVSKAAVVLAGAAIVGAYEWYAESNPDTVPAIGLKKIIGSVLSWFGLVAKDDKDKKPATENNVGDKQGDQAKLIQAVKALPVNVQPMIVQPSLIIENDFNEPTHQSTATTATTSTTSTTSTTTTMPISQPTVRVETKPELDDKGASLMSGEDDRSLESLSWSDDEKEESKAEVLSEEDDKNVISVKSKVLEKRNQAAKVSVDAQKIDDKTKEEIKPIEKKSEPKNDDVTVVSSALDKIIGYSKTTGKWFVDLFSKKNNVAYETYVKTLGTTIAQMEDDTNKVVVSDKNTIVQATKDLALSLIQDLKDTHAVLQGYVGYSGYANAGLLGSELQEQRNKTNEKRSTVLQDLRKQFVLHPGLEKKVNDLEKVINEYANTLEKKGMYTLGTGLSHRLSC